MNQLKTGWLSMLAKEFDNILDAIQAIILSFLVKLGPFCVALMPALFTAYAIYHTFQAEAGRDLALLFAVVVGLALETVGIVATHTAIDLYNGSQARVIQAGKFWLMLALVPVYVVGVFLTVYFSGDAFKPLVKSLGMASPFLTVIVYIAVALARDLSNIKLKQDGREQRELETDQRKLDHELRLQLEQLKLDHERTLRKDELEANERVERARIRADVQRTRADVRPVDPEHDEQPPDNPEYPPEYTELLGIVRERSADKPFSADDAQKWTGRGKTSIYDILNYGKESGVVHQIGRGRYVMNGRN